MNTAKSQNSRIEELNEGLRETNYQSKVAAEQWLNIGGRDYRLVGKTIRIGRALDNDIVLEDKSVSRYHALLSLVSTSVVLEDLKSRNGIKVNGERLRRAELKNNDRIKIGELDGVYFQRVKKVSPKSELAAHKIFANLDPQSLISQIVPKVKDFHEKVSPYLSQIQGTSPAAAKRKRLAILSFGILFLGAFYLLTSNSSHPGFVEANVGASDFGQIVEKPVDRRAFENCLELEDLGNFRQATACFKTLPLTADVNSALTRINHRQSELTEKRYKEGQSAFENYYFDIAILKWQEVLLIAEDSSEFRTEAEKGIMKAEQLRKLR